MKIGADKKKEFDEVYDYIKYEIMKYDKEMKLPNNFVFRLYGLACGKFSYRAPKDSSFDDMPIIYPFPIILATVIKCKSKLLFCMQTVKFADENHKINTIFKILEENINDVKLAYDRKMRDKQKIDSVDAEYMVREVQEYNKKSELKDKFKELL